MFHTTILGQPSNLPNPTPIDGGIGLLIAAGVAYGAKKVTTSINEPDRG